MPELRKDPVIGRWVIISTERGKRPSDFEGLGKKRSGGFCPFCPGNEDQTPPEIKAIRPPKSPPNSPGWSLRVFPNKFPALMIEGNINREGIGIFDKMNGVGAHEVIVETPDHNLDMADLELPQIKDVLFTYRERTLDLKKDPRFRYILIFKNQGELAGASLEHSHSQLIATPIVPKRVMEEIDGARKYYDYKERCIFCDIIAQETRDGIRMVSENEDFLAIEPFAPRFPFETWIMPKFHQCSFERIGDESITLLAGILKEVLSKVCQGLNYPPYNFVIHTSPCVDHHEEEYHWHIEFMPRLTRVAGFEWGTGFYINPTPPEEAAAFLRGVKL